jgi:hypothetical protein
MPKSNYKTLKSCKHELGARGHGAKIGATCLGAKIHSAELDAKTYGAELATS